VIKVGRTILRMLCPSDMARYSMVLLASLEKCLERLNTSEKSMLELVLGAQPLGLD